MTTQHYTPKHTDAGTFYRVTTVSNFWEFETDHNRRIRSGVRGFMFANEQYEILNVSPTLQDGMFNVDYVLPNGAKGTGEFPEDTRVTVYKAEPNQPAALPPARPVAIGRADLVKAVRHMFARSGKMNQAALLSFILDVMESEVPETSPDPAPLVKFVTVLASGEAFVNVHTAAAAALNEYIGGNNATPV